MDNSRLTTRRGRLQDAAAAGVLLELEDLSLEEPDLSLEEPDESLDELDEPDDEEEPDSDDDEDEVDAAAGADSPLFGSPLATVEPAADRLSVR